MCGEEGFWLKGVDPPAVREVVVVCVSFLVLVDLVSC